MLASVSVTLAGCGQADVAEAPNSSATKPAGNDATQGETPSDQAGIPADDVAAPKPTDTEPKGIQTDKAKPAEVSLAELVALQNKAIIDLQRVGGKVKTVDNYARLLLGSNTLITDDLLAGVKDIYNVRWIWLQNNPQVTDGGIAHFAGLTELENLVLTGTSISDDGLRHLSGLTKLKHLVLNGTSISNTGLEHLQGLENLKTLFLIDTKVTDQGIATLKASLPGCKIKK